MKVSGCITDQSLSHAVESPHQIACHIRAEGPGLEEHDDTCWEYAVWHSITSGRLQCALKEI